MTASERHNELVRDFVLRFGRECKTSGELMVVLESLMLAGMELNYRLFQAEPSVASGLVEDAIQRAILRFTEIEHG